MQRSELATATFVGFWASLARMRVRLSLMGAALRAASHSSGFKTPSQPSALWTARGRKAHQFAIAELIESISGRSSQGISETGIDMHGAHARVRAPLANSSLTKPAHVRYPPLSDLGGEHRAKPVPPKPDGLMADVDPPLGQQILDVAQRQRVPDVHHHDQTDHFWRAVEISERVAHGLKLLQPEAGRKIGLTMPSRARGRMWRSAAGRRGPRDPALCEKQ